MEEYPTPPRSLIKLTMSLKGKKYRKEEKLSTAEGFRLIEEALNENIPLHSAYFTLDALKERPETAVKIKSQGIDVFKVSPGEMERLSPLKTPPGSMIVYRTNFTPPARKGNITTAIYKISDPGNLGTVIRTSDWFGVTKVILSTESAELFNPSTVRGSMGSIFRMPVDAEADLISELAGLKEAGYKIAVALTRGGQKPFRIKDDVVLVTGDEYGELPEEIVEMANYKLTIPQKGGGESLNLASAVSILLYAISEG